MSKKIKLIIGSTRQGRIAEPIAKWLVSEASKAGHELEVLDLKEINLPFFDAPVPPKFMPTQIPAGKAWQAMVADAEGFIFLTPEYNRSITAPLKNAIDFLDEEWKDKPAAIVSYGYTDGGLSAANHLKDIFKILSIQAVEPAIAIKFNSDTFEQAGGFKDIEVTLGDYRQSFIEAVEAVEAK